MSKEVTINQEELENMVDQQEREIESIVMVTILGLSQAGYSMELAAFKIIELGMGQLFASYSEADPSNKISIKDFTTQLKARVCESIDNTETLLKDGMLDSSVDEESATAH